MRTNGRLHPRPALPCNIATGARQTLISRARSPSAMRFKIGLTLVMPPASIATIEDAAEPFRNNHRARAQTSPGTNDRDSHTRFTPLYPKVRETVGRARPDVLTTIGNVPRLYHRSPAPVRGTSIAALFAT